MDCELVHESQEPEKYTVQMHRRVMYVCVFLYCANKSTWVKQKLTTMTIIIPVNIKEMLYSMLALSNTKMDSPTCTQNQTDPALNHLQCCHKLNSADECQRLPRREVKLDRVQEMCIVHLDIHKHI